VEVAIEIVYPSKISPINREATLRVVIVVNGCPIPRKVAPIHVPIILYRTAANDRVRNRDRRKNVWSYTESSETGWCMIVSNRFYWQEKKARPTLLVLHVCLLRRVHVAVLITAVSKGVSQME
jgi:hypothetical protein